MEGVEERDPTGFGHCLPCITRTGVPVYVRKVRLDAAGPFVADGHQVSDQAILLFSPLMKFIGPLCTDIIVFSTCTSFPASELEWGLPLTLLTSRPYY